MSENIVSVNNLSVSFDYQENFLSKKQKIKAVNNINIKIKKGSFFGLVGESGSGKTTLGRAILGANKISKGNVIFSDLVKSGDTKRSYNGALIFYIWIKQDPLQTYKDIEN